MSAKENLLMVSIGKELKALIIFANNANNSNNIENVYIVFW